MRVGYVRAEVCGFLPLLREVQKQVLRLRCAQNDRQEWETRIRLTTRPQNWTLMEILVWPRWTSNSAEAPGAALDALAIRSWAFRTGAPL